jgi:hypothetical protein
MSAKQTPPAEPTTAKRAAEQFDHEFQRYTTKQVRARLKTSPYCAQADAYISTDWQERACRGHGTG